MARWQLILIIILSLLYCLGAIIFGWRFLGKHFQGFRSDEVAIQMARVFVGFFVGIPGLIIYAVYFLITAAAAWIQAGDKKEKKQR